MRVMLSRVFCCAVVAALFLPFPGCGKDNTPTGPEVGEVQRYLDEHPEAAARLDDDEDVEPDGDDAGGEG